MLLPPGAETGYLVGYPYPTLIHGNMPQDEAEKEEKVWKAEQVQNDSCLDPADDVFRPAAAACLCLINVDPAQMGRYKELFEAYEAKYKFDVIVEYTEVMNEYR